MAADRVTSADSHFVEPPATWAGPFDAKFRDRAPHSQQGYRGWPCGWFTCENLRPVQVRRFFGSGKSSEELPGHLIKSFEVAPKNVRDPEECLKEQERDGVTADGLYTCMGMLLFGLDDSELRAACFTAFNDWTAEYCSYGPKWLLGPGAGTLEDTPPCARELEWTVRKGVRGALIWSSPPEDKPCSDPVYDPVWAAARDLNIPLSQEIQLTMANMFPCGVFECLPRLQHVSAENDLWWLPHFTYQLDHAYDGLQHIEGYALRMLPTEHLKANIWATFQFETTNVDFTREAAGTEQIMWSSDYPHTDPPWPHSREFIPGAFDTMVEDDVATIVGGSAADLHGIDWLLAFSNQLPAGLKNTTL